MAPARDSASFTWAASAEEADMLIMPVPEWVDDEAPDRLTARTLPTWLPRLFLYSVNDDPVAWAPGVFASLPRHRTVGGGFRGGCYVVHHHREPGGMGQF